MIDLENKSEFLTRKTNILELIILLLKCGILFYLESAYAKEAVRINLKRTQEKEIEEKNKAEKESKKGQGEIIL